mmetsp:Transcript_18614/g.33055  ORF Transcript_18614/g.33055 Transcript_18614/m.33055 type:complete len:307 (-) Transcript_18614:324-1244(-)
MILAQLLTALLELNALLLAWGGHGFLSRQLRSLRHDHTRAFRGHHRRRNHHPRHHCRRWHCLVFGRGETSESTQGWKQKQKWQEEGYHRQDQARNAHECMRDQIEHDQAELYSRHKIGHETAFPGATPHCWAGFCDLRSFDLRCVDIGGCLRCGCRCCGCRRCRRCGCRCCRGLEVSREVWEAQQSAQDKCKGQTQSGCQVWSNRAEHQDLSSAFQGVADLFFEDRRTAHLKLPMRLPSLPDIALYCDCSCQVLLPECDDSLWHLHAEAVCLHAEGDQDLQVPRRRHVDPGRVITAWGGAGGGHHL